MLFSLYVNDLPLVCPDVEILLYADDAVIYVHSSTKQQAALKLTSAMNYITTWLDRSCLTLNVGKTVSMFFSKRPCSVPDPDIMISGQNLQVVTEYKYLGVWIDSNLCFRTHVKSMCKRVRFNLSNFRFVRDSFTFETAMIYMNAMIIPHFTYCLTSWAQANKSIMRSLESLYKHTLKVLV